MKRQIIRNLDELKSQNYFEKSPKAKHNFNYLENLDSNVKYNSNKKDSNIENNKEKLVNRNKRKGKMGKLEYEIEPRNILLIPDNFNIKNNNIKIWEKELSTKEKNYFISETNFQLIKDALNEKENNINELKLLEDNKDKEISLLKNEKQRLEESNNELILQIQKNDIYFNKMYQLLKYVFNYYDCFNDNEIKKYINEQNLEFLIYKQNISQKICNQKKEPNINNNTDDSNEVDEENKILSLFDVNQDEIIKELEKYKKMSNELRNQLNYITDIKSNEKINENGKRNDITKQLLECQKKINELNSENNNYVKENAYLKLLCKNMHFEKKIRDIDDKNKIIKELEQSLNEEKAINTNLKKENEILKKNSENLIKEISHLKMNFAELNDEKKLKDLELEKIKSEKEKCENIINNMKLKSSEEMRNKNNIYSRKMNLEMNKPNKSNWKKLKIDNNERFIFISENNKNNDDNDDKNDFYKKMKSNYEGMNTLSEQFTNTELLMFLYNKSKQLEEEITNK